MHENVSSLTPPEAAEEAAGEASPKDPVGNKELETSKRDDWDKADIILKFLGAVATAAAVAGVGIFGSLFLADRQEKENNFRKYTELMSRREEADTALRKEMFSPIIKDLLDPKSAAEPEKLLLNIELLAHNFHESLDLKPLFKEVYKKLAENRQDNGTYIERLTRVTRAVVERQVAMLAEAGGKRDGNVDLESLIDKPDGITVIDEPILVKTETDQPPIEKQVRIEVLGADIDKQQLTVRLVVKAEGDNEEEDTVFTLGLFDFPMEDNVRLPHGLRCALVLNHFDSDNADFTFLYFPGSRISFKETDSLHNLKVLKSRSNN